MLEHLTLYGLSYGVDPGLTIPIKTPGETYTIEFKNGFLKEEACEGKGEVGLAATDKLCADLFISGSTANSVFLDLPDVIYDNLERDYAIVLKIRTGEIDQIRSAKGLDPFDWGSYSEGLLSFDDSGELLESQVCE